MKKLLGCFLCVMLLVFGFTPTAWTLSFDLQGVNYPSQISALVDFNYSYVGDNAYADGTFNISITNTSSIASSLTAFAWNIPEGVGISGFSSFGNPPNWGGILTDDGINTPGQFGKFDIAGITGPNFNGGNVADGIPMGSTFNFEFGLSGSGLDLLASDFLNTFSAAEPGNYDPQYFIARFQGIGPCDLSDVGVVPEPATILLLGSGLAGLAGFGRKRFKK
jgi:hypothetical protein